MGMIQERALHGHCIAVSQPGAAQHSGGRGEKIEGADIYIMAQAHIAIKIIGTTDGASPRKIAGGIYDIGLTHTKVGRHITPGADQIYKLS